MATGRRVGAALSGPHGMRDTEARVGMRHRDRQMR